MSATRTTLRLIAGCVASCALVGAAAMPALADGLGHDRTSTGQSRSYRPDAIRSDHDRDRDRHFNHGRFGHRWNWNFNHGRFGHHDRDRHFNHGRR